ncbi:membrane protease FtsH catalytic subunit (plasmid) [Stanieria cyanosphaera PCC 7437]|uniref:ATP-dependent zinc metalloprotease FtsH n=1 Tax=Stanieria cyanosphaera (strain ATCC 29371 / PCC 7437) TaxID=111780 RepID=K9Y1C1_STAC7|nr:ATP-dependent zinc metalloprotease FtsH [Stanieria cyanosphaera]AFZ38119.1 membrane protease FtsH catalytic subunit [Stanieria cyanosphaera PCC 7437]
MPEHENPHKTPRSSQWKLTLIVSALCLILFSLFLTPTSSSTSQSYSKFIDLVESDRVEQVTISPNRLEYTLKSEGFADNSEQIFTTVPVTQDTELPKILRQHQVEFSATPSNSGSGFWGFLQLLFFLFLLVNLGGLLFSRSQQGTASSFAVGRSNARIYSEGSMDVTFDDVAGVDEAKTELYEIVDFLQNKTKYALVGAKIPKGVLLVGPPGTGKTLLAKAIAGEAGVPFFSISGSEFIEMFVGVGASRVRDLFDRAKKQAPAIVFIDELDALGKSRASGGAFMGGNDEREQTLNQLLAEMDGFEPNAGVILLAATNRPEVLDPALLRPGRFDRRIVVDRPDKSGRLAILEVHARNVSLAEDVDLDKLAARTPGFAGADLANLINESALLAARNNRSAVTMADFNEATERILTGLEKRSRVLNETEKKTVAYHEVGHAIVGWLMPGTDRVEKISIVPRGIGALGYTLQLPEEDRFLAIEDEIRGRIATLLGGRAAEELIFGKVSTGASDDIQKATELAERYVTLYGMSDRLGPIAFEKVQQQYLGGMTNPRRQVSQKIAEEIDLEVKAVIDGAHQVAKIILWDNRELLTALAQILLKQEVLEAGQLRSHLGQAQSNERVDRWLQTGELAQNNLLTPALSNNGKTLKR